jgi:hypothetical protein
MKRFIPIQALIGCIFLVALWQAHGQETNQESGSATNLTYQLPTSTIIEFLVRLSPQAQAAVANGKNGNLSVANVGLALPPGFEPTNNYPVLVINATSDGDGSSIRSMKLFTNVALKLGFVVLAADGPFGKPTNDTPAFRFAMLSSALEHIHRSWPASKAWPLACAGVSGGAKWSGVIGASLSNRGHRLLGVFMGACNEDYASEAAKMYGPSPAYKRTPIFLSSGNHDNIATPTHHETVRRSLVMNGFNMVRLESHEGGHTLDPVHLETALKWFLRIQELQIQAAKTAAKSNTNKTTRATKPRISREKPALTEPDLKKSDE